MIDPREDPLAAARGVRDQARSLGIEIWPEGPRLRYRTRNGDLPVGLRDAFAKVREEVLEIVRHERSIEYHLAPMSWNQFGMWHDQVGLAAPTGLNVGHAVRLDRPIRLEVLTRAAQVLVDRHSVLRTDFPRNSDLSLTDRRPSRRVWGFRPIVLHQCSEAAPEVLSGVLGELVGEPFHLETAPLFRVHHVPISGGGQVVLLVAHHLVVDGLSIRLMGPELARVYQALETDAPLPKSHSPEGVFTQFVEMQERYLEASAERARAHWKQVFTTEVQELALPLDQRRSHAQRRATALERVLRGESVDRIESFSREAAVTPFETLLTIYIAVLRRVTHQQDLVVGTAVHGRGVADLAGALGNFVNVLPIRTTSALTCSFRELLTETTSAVRSAQEFESYPYPLLVRDLRAAGAFLAPPVQTTFGLTDLEGFVGASAVQKPDENLEVLSVSQADAQFPISLDMTRHGRDYHASWRYDPDSLSDGLVSGWAHAFEALLQRALDMPDHPLDKVLLTSFKEEESVGPSRAIGPPVIQRFAAQVLDCPQAIATIDASGSWTFEELSHRALGYSSALSELGTGPCPRVGVCMSRSSEFVAALLGVLGAGGVYVPLDPTYPKRRLEYMASVADLSVIITDFTEDPLPGVAVPKIRSGQHGTHHRPFIDVSLDQPAYVMFTSGSSGQPKGVEVTHRALANLLSAISREPGFKSTDVLLAVTTESFDISVLELLLPLYCGGTVVVASRDDRADGRRLAELIEAHDVTVMQATPSSWRMLYASGWTGHPDLKILCGGERLTQELADKLCQHSEEVWNLYGPTETTIWSTCARVKGGATPTLGRAIDNTKLLVVDDQLRPLHKGSIGQLLIGGAGVSLGYVSDVELTSDRFITLPHSGDLRWYQTGDLVRTDADGALEFIGRSDEQLKVRGGRVEPGEIEEAIRKLGSITDVAVGVTDERIVAYVVNETGTSIDALRRSLELELPRFMLPSLFIEVSDLPRTLNGKLDRGSLPLPAVNGTTQDPPRIQLSYAEELLAEVWCSLLGLETVQPDDNFFHLGGHSLLVVECAAVVHAKVGVWLDPRDFFFKSLRQLGRSLPDDTQQ